MRTNQQAANRTMTLAPMDGFSSLEAVSSRARRRFAITVAMIGLGFASSWNIVIVADQPEPLNRLGRIAGRGYSDGYHACKTTGMRVLADLPPVSYAKRGELLKNRLTSTHANQAAGFATYYDQFDHACDSQQGCDSMSMQGQVYVRPQMMPEPQYRPLPDMRVSVPTPVPSSPMPSLTPNEIRLPSAMYAPPVFDPVAEPQREREERQRELDEQRRMLAEQERYRQFQVFEKLRNREDADNVGSDLLGDEVRGQSSPVERSSVLEGSVNELTHPVVPSVDSSVLPTTDDELLIEKVPTEDAELRIPSSTILLDTGLSSQADPQVHVNSFLATPPTVEASLLAQAELERPRPLASRFPPTVIPSPAKLPQVQASTLFAPTKLPDTASVAENSTKEQKLATAGANAAAPIVQPAEAEKIAPAQEPEKRIASGDWLIIRQPK